MRDLLIIGAGPSGLSAAIAAGKGGLDYQVLEQGVLVNSIFRFPPQMVFFTTPELLEIGGLPFVSPYDKPTRTEALRYYRRVVDTYDLRIALDEAVISVTRELDESAGSGPSTDLTAGPSSELRTGGHFIVETRTSRGVTRVREARNVVFAIGYYDRPNMLGVPGEDLPHVSHFYADPHPYYRQRVVIVGGGNSAAEAALEMYRAGVSVTLVHRAAELKHTVKYWVRPDIENRIKAGSIAAAFCSEVVEIRPMVVVVRSATGETREIAADAVFLLTGYRADKALMQAAGVRFNNRDAPVFNPETFETTVPGLFVAGGAIAGVDTGTIFIENGRFHGERIVEVIAGRL